MPTPIAIPKPAPSCPPQKPTDAPASSSQPLPPLPPPPLPLPPSASATALARSLPPARAPRLHPQQHPKPASPDINSALLSKAHSFAIQSFRSHVFSVLRHASTVALRRLIAGRVRDRLRSFPPERLADGKISVEELLSSSSPGADDDVDDNATLKVSEKDIERCYVLATRVGNKWAEVLSRRGYDQFAEAAFDVTRRGHFLEPSAAAAASSASVDGDAANNVNNELIMNKYVTPYTALHHGLRRYPPDCDGSGLPSATLPDILQNYGEHSSALEAIDQIDIMAQSGDTYWSYGWDAIIEAVERNRKRIDYYRVDAVAGREEYQIVPKKDYEGALSLVDMGKKKDTETEDDLKGTKTARNGKGPPSKLGSSKKRKTVQFSTEEARSEAEIDFLIAAQDKVAARIMKKRRKRERGEVAATSVDNERPGVVGDALKECDMNTKKLKVGRPPSSIGEEVLLSWDEDVLGSMTMEERQKLIVSAIHPPYPFESNKQSDDEDDDRKELTTEYEEKPHTAVVCGALKEIGLTHLWEQTRNLPLPGSDKKDGRDSIEDGADAHKQSEAEGKPEIIHGASEAHASHRSQNLALLRKRTLKRALKERCGRRTVAYSDLRAEMMKMSQCSKVRWTKEEENNSGIGSTDSTLSPSLAQQLCDQLDERGQRPWLQMDLGECTIELLEGEEKEQRTATEDDSEQGQMKAKKDVAAAASGKGQGEEDDSKKTKKRFLAFRSLELALMH